MIRIPPGPAQPYQLYCCNGKNNVGHIGHKAVSSLAQEGFGTIGCLTALLADQDCPQQSDHVPTAKIVVIDGCGKQCLAKVMTENGIGVTHHLVVTDLGLDISPQLTCTNNQLELVKDGIRACCADYDTTAARGGCMCGL